MRIGDFPSMLKEAAKEWSEDKVSRHAAALSYYTVFSLAPLLLIAIAVAGLIFGEAAARDRIVEEIGGLIGTQGAEAVQGMIARASEPREGIIATVIGVVVLLFGASGAFSQLQDSLNDIWEVRRKPESGFLGVIGKRFASFGMVLVIAFLLLVSLVLSAALSALGAWAGGLLPDSPWLLRAGHLVITLGVVTALFALIFKILPDVRIRWGDVWMGAFVTALLFTAGRYLIGLYLGRSAVGSTFGAAGSLVIILLWVYYSSLILFFGSEFTQVYATRRGSRAVPDEDAEAVTKPLPIEGRPSLTPTAAKGAIPEGGFHAPGAPVGIASFSESDSRKRDQGTRSVDKASRIPPLKAAKAAKGGKRSGRFWKPGSRRFGAASLAMSLALVTAIGFLGRLIGFLRHPRTT
jgi:membrane protein